jgi:hypothetical protein
MSQKRGFMIELDGEEAALIVSALRIAAVRTLRDDLTRKNAILADRIWTAKANFHAATYAEFHQKYNLKNQLEE